MGRRWLRVALSAVLLAAVFRLDGGAGGPAGAASAVRVMPLGDSITEGIIGSDGVPSYRKYFWDEVTGAGTPIDLVGSRSGGAFQPGIDAVNAQLPGFVAGQTTAQSPVTLVDAAAGYNPAWNYESGFGATPPDTPVVAIAPV